MDDNRLSEIEPISPRTIKRINLSPELIERKINHQIEMDVERVENDIENKINSCCSGTSDKRLLVFISQMTITLLVLFFCFIQIILKTDKVEFYLSLVSLILGLYLPQPQLKKQ